MLTSGDDEEEAVFVVVGVARLMFMPPSASARSSTDAVVVFGTLEPALGKHASTSNRTTILISSISYHEKKARLTQEKGNAVAAHICDCPMMTRGRTARRGARRRVLKTEPIRATGGRLARAALPAAQHKGLGPHELDVDPEVAHLSARRRVEPAQELAQAVAVRDDVDRRPVDGRCRRLGAVYRVRGGEEGKHRILGQPCAVLVDKNGAVVGLQREWDGMPCPYGRRTYDDLISDMERKTWC